MNLIKKNLIKIILLLKKHSSKEIKIFVLEMIDYLKNKSKFKNYFLNKKAINSYKKIIKRYETEHGQTYNGKLYFFFSKFFLKKNINIYFNKHA